MGEGVKGNRGGVRGRGKGKKGGIRVKGEE